VEISVRELKDQLSAVLRRVRQGEVVLVTSRGRAVARLTPVEARPEEAESAAVARLCALPWVRAGSGEPPKGLEPGVRLSGRGPSAAEIVAEGRE
jgi:prevent-host-death family protein